MTREIKANKAIITFRLGKVMVKLNPTSAESLWILNKNSYWLWSKLWRSFHMPELSHNMSFSGFLICCHECDMCMAHIWQPVSKSCTLFEKESRDCQALCSGRTFWIRWILSSQGTVRAVWCIVRKGALKEKEEFSSYYTCPPKPFRSKVNRPGAPHLWGGSSWEKRWETFP